MQWEIFLVQKTLIANSSSCMLLLSVRLVRKQAHAGWNQCTRKVTLPDCRSPGQVSQDSVRLSGWQGFGYHQFNLELTGWINLEDTQQALFCQ